MTEQQLAAVRARLRAFKVEAKTSAVARRFYEDLKMIASDTYGGSNATSRTRGSNSSSINQILHHQ
jgi:hypothetical protein